MKTAVRLLVTAALLLLCLFLTNIGSSQIKNKCDLQTLYSVIVHILRGTPKTNPDLYFSSLQWGQEMARQCEAEGKVTVIMISTTTSTTTTTTTTTML